MFSLRVTIYKSVIIKECSLFFIVRYLIVTKKAKASEKRLFICLPQF